MDKPQFHKTSVLFTRAYWLTMILVVVYFIFNYLGSPYVLQTYVAITAIVTVGAVIFEYEDTLVLIFVHFFIEGQGRVVFGYNPLARIMFDLIIVIFIAKYIIKNKKIFPEKNFPNLLRFFILAHFIVFTISLFNVKGAGVWVNIPMIKVYILPFLTFFIMLDSPLDFSSKAFRRLVLTVSVLTIGNGIISAYQYTQNTPLILSISTHYGEILRFNSFTKFTFRPYGTTYAAGGISTYLPLTLGLFFLAPISSVEFLLVIASSIVMLVLCQVRTAMIQYVLMFTQFSYIYLRASKLNFKSSMTMVAAFIAFFFILQGTYSFLSQGVEQRFVDMTLGRFTTIFETKTYEKSRLGVSDLTRAVIDKVSENPIGLGPGRTHAVTELMGQTIDNDPVYNLDYSWSYDNLWATIALEFGVAGIFYAGIIILMPCYLFSMMVNAFRRKKKQHFKVIAIAFITVFTIVLANWGGVGIPYNPVSFMFWFWCAMGFQGHRLSMETPPGFDAAKKANVL
ncbi:MAG: hypothetical protein H7336_17530 [Bacteriovorax sp.]|nr:hypothetical protein [Bacteriovorax sp.]